MEDNNYTSNELSETVKADAQARALSSDVKAGVKAGRPRKYATKEEAKAAQKQQIKEWHQKHRGEKKKNTYDLHIMCKKELDRDTILQVLSNLLPYLDLKNHELKILTEVDLQSNQLESVHSDSVS